MKSTKFGLLLSNIIFGIVDSLWRFMELKVWLETEGMQNKELADLLDVTPNTVTNWIHRRTHPSKKRIERIKKITGGKVEKKDFDYFIHGRNIYG